MLGSKRKAKKKLEKKYTDEFVLAGGDSCCVRYEVRNETIKGVGNCLEERERIKKNILMS